MIVSSCSLNVCALAVQVFFPLHYVNVIHSFSVLFLEWNISSPRCECSGLTEHPLLQEYLTLVFISLFPPY